jgi:hypothetical protein
MEINKNFSFYTTPTTQGVITERVRIQANGNVGIGTNNPQALLELWSSISSKPRIIISGEGYESGSNDSGIALLCGVNNTDNRQLWIGDSSKLIKNTTNNMISFIPDAPWENGAIINSIKSNNTQSKLVLNECITLLSNGNVGIGTKNPQEELHLHHTLSAQNVYTQYTDAGTTANALRGTLIGKTSTHDFGFSNMEINKNFSFYTTPTTQGVIAERVRIQANGNVGIGTKTVSAILHIAETIGTEASPTAGSIIIDHGNTGGASSITFRSRVNRGSDYGYIQYQDSATIGGNGETAKFIIGTQNDNTDHICLMPTGNVGIGTDNPAYKLHVEDGSLFIGDVAKTGTTITTTANGYRLVFDNTYNGTDGYGTSANKIVLWNNNTNIYGFGIEASGIVYQSATNHRFYTGTTNTAYGTLGMTLSTAGTLSVRADIIAYVSDERFKTITSNIDNPLEIIANLRGFYYKPNELARKHGIIHNNQEIGLSAQDVQKVVPEIVKLAPCDTHTNADGSTTSKSGNNYLTLSYDKLAPVFVEAIKSLHKLINNQNKIIQKQDKEIKIIQKKYAKLKRFINQQFL